MGKQNFIVINGKKYDVVTGRLLTDAPDVAGSEQIKAETVSPEPINGRAVDGFVRQRTPGKSLRKQPQRSRTLMRKSVQKPSAQAKPKPKPGQVAGISKQSLGISPRRVSAAKEIAKSPHIQKFGNNQARSSVVRKHTAQPVRPTPATLNAAATPRHETQPATSHPKLVKRTEKLIETALANARSHEEPALKLPRKHKSRFQRATRRLGVSRKAVAISSTVLAVVLLAGFYAINNVPNLSMRLAASRAGFDAKMPGYKPAGFSFRGPISYQTGAVMVAFHSNTDSREYNFVQNNSNWNSDALLANFVVAEGKQYQTYQDRGRTLYIYDGSNATWVDDGVWYRIEGDSRMTTDQLIRIAASI